jgi:hypothetical protein
MSKILKGLNESTRNKYDNNRTGFSRGPRDDERHDLDVQKPTREEWALKINGKVWSKDGKAVTFSSKEQALKARQSLLAKRPELEVGLVTRSVSEAGTGLDIDRSIPGRTIARISGTSPDPAIGKLRHNPHAKKLPDFHDDSDEYDQWSGKVDPSIHDDEEDTFHTDYTGDEDGELKEISNDALAKYKTAAALDAGKADSEGDYKRADKRFSGIVKATKKQFANDTKTVKEDINSIYSEAKSLLTKLDENMQQKVINALQKKVDDEQPAEPFKTGYPRVKNPQILGTQNRAKTAYYPPSKPPIKKLDKPLPENLGNELKSKSLQALQQVKQNLEQQRMAELEQWEQDFKQNTVSKFTAREPNLRQRATSTSMVAMPGEKHSELKTRLGQLNKAIEKQGILDNLVQRLDKKGLMTPNIEAGVDTSMLARDGARDNYVELNKKLDKALEYVKNRLLTNKAAYAKPKAIDENDSVPTRMKMNDYYDLADSIQEKLKQAIQTGDKARIQELNKQRDELDAHVKKHGMMPEAIDEEQLDELSCWSGYHRVAGTKAGFPGSCAKNKTNEEEIDEINRRGFLKGLGAGAAAGYIGKKINDTEVYVVKGYGGTSVSVYATSPEDAINNVLNDKTYNPALFKNATATLIPRTEIEKQDQINKSYDKKLNPDELRQRLHNISIGDPDFSVRRWIGSPDSVRKHQVNGTEYQFWYYDGGLSLDFFDGNLKAIHKSNKMILKDSESCPHCGGEMVSEELMNEKKDACYYKVKSRYKVWPSAYASGALVKCRKKGASNWGNGGKKNESSILEGIERADESLHDWFNKEKWVRMDTKGNIKGPCAREPGEGKPKCLPQSKAHSLGKKGRASAAQRKRREDPNPERSGKAINVDTKKSKG